VAYLIICFSFGLAGGLVGRSKGSSFFLWFLISAVAPIAGLLAALLYRVEHDELRRQCPGCGRIVPIHDALCTRCGTELDFPDVVIEPASATRAREATPG
jgi:hypothetical protein